MWELFFERIVEAGPILFPFTVLILFGAAMEWWVWGYVYRREVKEKEYWRDKAIDLLGLGEEVVDVAHDLAEELT